MAINIGFIFIAWAGKAMGPNYLMLTLLALSFSGLGILYYGRSRQTMVIAKGTDGITELKTTSKVVALKHEPKAADLN